MQAVEFTSTQVVLFNHVDVQLLSMALLILVIWKILKSKDDYLPLFLKVEGD
jgi:hypothetical protein